MRGEVSVIGETRVTQNGYHQTRTEDGWRYTHHLVAEEALGRKLQAGERVRFIDGDRNNRGVLNLEVTMKRSSKQSRINALKVRIAALQDELTTLESE
jgi:hypothetical protein